MSFSALTVINLRKIAKENGLKGYSRLRKVDLIHFLETNLSQTTVKRSDAANLPRPSEVVIVKLDHEEWEKRVDSVICDLVDDSIFLYIENRQGPECHEGVTYELALFHILQILTTFLIAEKNPEMARRAARGHISSQRLKRAGADLPDKFFLTGAAISFLGPFGFPKAKKELESYNNAIPSIYYDDLVEITGKFDGQVALREIRTWRSNPEVLDYYINQAKNAGELFLNWIQETEIVPLDVQEIVDIVSATYPGNPANEELFLQLRFMVVDVRDETTVKYIENLSKEGVYNKFVVLVGSAHAKGISNRLDGDTFNIKIVEKDDYDRLLYEMERLRNGRILEENPTVDMLKELPPEMKMHMAVQMRYPDVVRFCATSTEAKRVCSTDYFWKLKIEHDFPKKPVGPEGKRRETYKKYWQDVQEKFLGCARQRHTECIESSIQLGIDPNFQNKKRETALMIAVSFEHSDIARLLLEHGADPNLQNKKGITALEIASEAGHTDNVRLLLEHSAKPDHQDKKGHTVLSLASFEGHIHNVQLLLEHDADPDLQDDEGNTALLHASRQGHIHIVRLLLEHGAKPDIQSVFGHTALLHASRQGHIHIVRLLLEHDADPNLQDMWSNTALMNAIYSKNADIVQLLLDNPYHKADPNIQTPGGTTALMRASKNGHTDIVRLLLKYGANPEIKDERRKTALDLASEMGNTGAVELLSSTS